MYFYVSICNIYTHVMAIVRKSGNEFELQFFQRVSNKDMKIILRQRKDYQKPDDPREPQMVVVKSALSAKTYLLSAVHEVANMRRWNIDGNKITLILNGKESVLVEKQRTNIDEETEQIMYATDEKARTQKSLLELNGENGDVIAAFDKVSLSLIAKSTQQKVENNIMNVTSLIEGTLRFY